MFLVGLVCSQILLKCLLFLSSLAIALFCVSGKMERTSSRMADHPLIPVNHHLQSYNPPIGQVSWAVAREDNRLVFGLSRVERGPSLGFLSPPPTIRYESTCLIAQEPFSS